MLDRLQTLSATFATLAWGPWLLVLLLGGGLYLLLLSRFAPFRYLGHALALIRGKHPEPDAVGQISHSQALASALAGTVGMGNIAGVALAISIGGPGAIFWMWMTAILGIATKFFTCTLAVMYRGKDSNGELQGGPMYVIREALPKGWHGLAYAFAALGLVGCLPVFQTNQLVQILRELVLIDQGWLAADADPLLANLSLGLALAMVSALVILGGLKRIARVALALVPFMGVLYLGTVLVVLFLNLPAVPALFAQIFNDAFTGSAVAGGGLQAMILYGVQRGAFSNEAGIGTEALAHGAARTAEPVREGLVAMLGPIIDTLLICTATALLILLSGVWQQGDANGVTLTALAFEAMLGTPGLIILFTCVVCFASTTIFTYSFYGSQCASFLFGVKGQMPYRIVYVSFILVAAIISLDTAINLIDGTYALMAIPTMVSTLILAPKVTARARVYFASLQAQRI